MSKEIFPIGPIKNGWWLAAVVAVVFAVLVFAVPWLLTRTWLVDLLGADIASYSETGQIGDTIGGIANPIIAFIALIFAAAAFWLQYVALQNQREEQDLQRFEDRFYNMLDVHRKNTARVENFASFQELFKSYVSIFRVVEEVFSNAYDQLSKDADIVKAFELAQYDEDEKSRKELIGKIAYGYYFYGIEYMLSACRYNVATELFAKVQAKLASKYFIKKYGERVLQDLPKGAKDYEEACKVVKDAMPDQAAKALEPKNEILGQYYRQLFQIVKFVDEQKKLDFSAKYAYMKQLRATLSDYAQVMLYYNSVSTVGQGWNKRERTINSTEDMGYIARYKLISNMPFFVKPVAIDPMKYYSDEAFYWRTFMRKEFFEFDNTFLK